MAVEMCSWSISTNAGDGAGIRTSYPASNHTTRMIPVLQPDEPPTVITKTRLFKYIENFTIKNSKFSVKNFDIFQISVKNIGRGNSLDPPCRCGSNEYPQAMFLSRDKKK